MLILIGLEKSLKISKGNMPKKSFYRAKKITWTVTNGRVCVFVLLKPVTLSLY